MTGLSPVLVSFAEFADTMEKARKLGTFKNFVAGRASEATVVNAFEKHSAVLRYLGAIDPTGEVHTDLTLFPLFGGEVRLLVCTVIFVQNLRNTDKINATKHCNCTIADVEHILAKYTWAKEAQKKIEKLKEEGKPLPKSFNEVTLRSLATLPSCICYYCFSGIICKMLLDYWGLLFRLILLYIILLCIEVGQWYWT